MEEPAFGKRWFPKWCLAMLNTGMIIPLYLLQTFVAVARSGRMRDAAARMALTPGAISQRIRELEDSINYRLFTRTSR